jgi:hypothetical protein
MSLSKLQAIFPCLPCTESEDDSYPNEKAALLSNSNKAALIADDVIAALLTTDLSGAALQMHLDSAVGTYGWTSNVAKWILEKLTGLLRDGHEKFGPALREAYEKATKIALSVEGFVVEHPVFCTIVALGVLTLMIPWVLGALGFVEVGIEAGQSDSCMSIVMCAVLTIEIGSFAARWMSMYGGLVPKGSLFSFFQRLGMMWWHWL